MTHLSDLIAALRKGDGNGCGHANALMHEAADALMANQGAIVNSIIERTRHEPTDYEREALIEQATWALIEWDTDTADRGVSDEHYRDRRADVERVFPILFRAPRNRRITQNTSSAPVESAEKGSLFSEVPEPSADARCCAHVKCPSGSLCCCIDEAPGASACVCLPAIAGISDGPNVDCPEHGERLDVAVLREAWVHYTAVGASVEVQEQKAAVFDRWIAGPRVEPSCDYEAGYAEGFHHGVSTPRGSAENDREQGEPSDPQVIERLRGQIEEARNAWWSATEQGDNGLVYTDRIEDAMDGIWSAIGHADWTPDAAGGAR